MTELGEFLRNFFAVVGLAVLPYAIGRWALMRGRRGVTMYRRKG